MGKAAGILFISDSGKALFLKRGQTALDFAGSWDFPGGSREADETAEECAIRECQEEIGFRPEGQLVFHTRTKGSAPKGVAGIGASPVLPVQEGAPVAPPVALPDVDYTTFVQHVGEEFTPELNDEHVGFAWAPIEQPPQPVHPGCQIALDRLAMNELGVARAIADGRLISPQRYENMYLFAIRITGTDVAFRPKGQEFVVRPGEFYTSSAPFDLPGGHSMPEFLARCNGLPVIFKHPPSALLNSDEFTSRVVGTVFLPYVAGDEVWAIVKIYVDDVARMMAKGDLSTSPGVNFADFSVNRKMTLHMRDGSKEKVLVEGDPSLLDHIALCELGVWDKGEEPSGIRSESREDSAMAEKAEDDMEKKNEVHLFGKKEEDSSKKDARKDADEEEKEDKAKDDADGGHTLEKTLGHIMDSIKTMADAMSGMGKRMDAFEEKEKGDSKKDAAGEEGKDEPEKTAADKAKKDADEKEEKEREDKAKKDAKARDDKARDDKAKDDKAKADSATLATRIEEVARMIPKDVNDDDYHALTDAQSRADDVFADFNMRAPRPQQGETVRLYERRCVRMLKEHSPTWKATDTSKLDDATFDIVRSAVYSEAKQAARNPVNVPAGQLRMVERKNDGHTIREFHGQPKTWMDQFAGPVQMRGEGRFLHPNLGQQ